MDSKKKNSKSSKAEEPETGYRQRAFKIYSSFDEQEEQQRKYYLSLSGKERLALMRKYTIIAYGMNGYDPGKQTAGRNFRIVK